MFLTKCYIMWLISGLFAEECRDGDFYLTVGLFENVEEICAVYDSEQKGN